MAGISDIHHELCLGLALWNGVDPILKERMFGLTGPQGNHGEDAKEYWWYLEGLPSHALLRWRYHYPQAAFPYQELIEENGRRGTRRLRVRAARHRRVRRRPVLGRGGHLRQGVADRGAREHHRREPRSRRGDHRRAADPVVPQHVAVGERDGRARALGVDGDAVVVEDHRLAGYRLEAAPGPDGNAPRGALLRQRDQHGPRSTAPRPSRAYPKDGINDHVVSRRGHGQPGSGGGPRRPGGTELTVPGRRHRRGPAPAATARAARGAEPRLADATFDEVVADRQREADEFYAAIAPAGTDEERMRVVRQASAGLIWSKQIYPYDVEQVARRRPRRQPPPPPARRGGRNAGWRHLDSFDVLAMPDPWEYPWFAAWDLAFHAIPWAHLDPAFAKYQLHGAAAGVVPAPQRRPAGVRVELRRRQPAGARAGGDPGVRHRRQHRHRLPRADLPEAAAQLHLVGQPAGPRRQQPVRRRLPRPGQHQPGRPFEPPARTAHRAGRRHGLDGLLLPGDAGARRARWPSATTSTTTWS